MSIVGNVESLWRYPVKSMRGEQMDEAFVGFAGIFGDRLFAFRGEARPKAFPYLTGREQATMLLYRPRFRHPEKAMKPPNWAEAENAGPGLNPVPADAADLAVEVETPSGAVLAVDDPALARELSERLARPEGLRLLRSDKSMTDCRPVSLFSVQTARQLGDELGAEMEKRRFRANIFTDLAPAAGFAENEFVGRTLRIGRRVVLSILERDARCAMITIDPDTAERTPAILRHVVKTHNREAGVYGAVLVEGVVRVGDKIEAID
ncbi:MAG TPA: MOSC domain-containing protein [Terriglobia bacterium]|nr:MOSC domain-containing protein [Terriglobia bacterium]